MSIDDFELLKEEIKNNPGRYTLKREYKLGDYYIKVKNQIWEMFNNDSQVYIDCTCLKCGPSVFYSKDRDHEDCFLKTEPVYISELRDEKSINEYYFQTSKAKDLFLYLKENSKELIKKEA